MLSTKKFDLKFSILQIALIYACLAFFLASCDGATVTTSCAMQAVAGGSQYCEETLAGD